MTITAAEFDQLTLPPTGEANEDPQLTQNFIEGFLGLIATPGELDKLLEGSSEEEKFARLELINPVLLQAPKETVANIFFALWQEWGDDSVAIPRTCNEKSVDWLMNLIIFNDLSCLLERDSENRLLIIETILASGDQYIIQKLTTKIIDAFGEKCDKIRYYAEENGLLAPEECIGLSEEEVENLYQEKLNAILEKASKTELNILRKFAALEPSFNYTFTQALISYQEDYDDEHAEVIEQLEEEGLIDFKNITRPSEAFKRTSVGFKILQANIQQAVEENRQSIARTRASAQRAAIVSASATPAVINNREEQTKSFRESVRDKTATNMTKKAEKTILQLNCILIEGTFEDLEKIKKIQFPFDHAIFVEQLTTVGDISVAVIRLAEKARAGDATARLRLKILRDLTQQLSPENHEIVMVILRPIFESLKKPEKNIEALSTHTKVAAEQDIKPSLTVKAPPAPPKTESPPLNTKEESTKKRPSPQASQKKATPIVKDLVTAKNEITALHTSFYNQAKKKFFRAEEKKTCLLATRSSIQNTHLPESDKASLYLHAADSLFAKLGWQGENTELAKTFRECAKRPNAAEQVKYRGKTI